MVVALVFFAICGLSIKFYEKYLISLIHLQNSSKKYIVHVFYHFFSDFFSLFSLRLRNYYFLMIKKIYKNI